MDRSRRQFNQAALALAAAGAVPRAYARDQGVAEYPSHALRMVIPFTAGGGTDILGRTIAEQLSKAWHESVVVENRTGGNGTIALAFVAKAPPDGYTMGIVTCSATVNVTLQGSKQPYDLIRDFAPISQVTAEPYLLVVNPALPVKNVADLIALAKSRPAPMTYGSSGVGGLSHLAGAMFGSLARIPLTHVPYRGNGEAMTAIVGKQIDMMFCTLLGARPMIAGGTLRPLAVSSAKHSSALPELPTMQEAGVPGYDVTDWDGVLAPAATPRPIIQKMNQAIVHALNQPDANKRIRADGSETVGSTPEAFAAHIRQQVGHWRALIAQLGIHAQ